LIKLRFPIFLSFLSCLWANPVFSLDIPTHTGPVVDLAGAFTQSENAQISASLMQFKRKYGPQIQVVTIPKLQDETIEGFSIKIADKWKLGSKDKDDGVLLLIATQDRKVRIEVGQGLEGDLPDALAGKIIRAGIIPFFKKGQINAGVLTGLGMIAESIGGELENIPALQMQRKGRSGGANLGYLLFLAFFLFGPMLGRRGRGGRGGIGASLLSGLLLGSILSGGRGGFGGGGFGGGGFGGGFGGGGGGFSGGGASGGW
jgi:uncharacterized protein